MHLWLICTTALPDVNGEASLGDLLDCESTSPPACINKNVIIWESQITLVF